MNKDTLQNIVVGLLGVLWAILCSVTAIIWHDLQSTKTNQEIHNAAAEVKFKGISGDIEKIEENNLKQWNVMDANTEKEEGQQVNIALNANNIKHLQNERSAD